jgi:hypothetical protein
VGGCKLNSYAAGHSAVACAALVKKLTDLQIPYTSVDILST